MYRQNQKLVDLVRPVVSGLGYELLGVKQLNGRSPRLRLYIDCAAGVTVDDCAAVSEQVMGVIDVGNLITGNYTLEVSSPGLDRPLFTLEQLVQHIGCPVYLKLYKKWGERQCFQGEIISANESAVCIKVVTGDEYEIPTHNIKHARLVPQF